MQSKTPGSYTSTLLRGLSILKCFSESDHSLGASDIAKMTGIPQPTVWRFCRSLQSAGYLMIDERTRLFRPGLALLGLGLSAISHFDLAQHARGFLVQIAEKFRVVSGITSREGLHMRVVDRHQSSDAVLTFNSRIGSILPIANSASGWAYLAALGENEREALIARIAHDQPAIWRPVHDRFREALSHYRDEAVIIASGTFHPEITSVAVPIASDRSNAIFPLYCSALSSALPRDLITEQLAPLMRKTAGDLSVVLPAHHPSGMRREA